MADAEESEPRNVPDSSQALVGFMSNDEWDELLAHVSGLIQQMEELPAGEVKTAVFELLTGIDAIHREGLRRLVRLFKEGVLEKVVSDPAIQSLMELYDLLPQQPDEEPAEQKPKNKFPTIPIKAVSSITSVKRRYPHWVPVLRHRDELKSGMVRAVDVDEHSVLLCRREDRFFAIEAHCGRDGSSLRDAAFGGYTLTCPNHTGCYYDVRQGTRVGGNEKLACYPVKQDEDGRLHVGLDMDFTPHLPSF